jgi:hypothetical protein
MRTLEGLLPYSQTSATGKYPEPGESNPHCALIHRMVHGHVYSLSRNVTFLPTMGHPSLVPVTIKPSANPNSHDPQVIILLSTEN